MTRRHQPARRADPDYFESAPCRQTDPDAFFPEKGQSSRYAKALCAGCPFQAACLTLAFDNAEPFGVWGGFSEYERRMFTKGRLGEVKAARIVELLDAARPAPEVVEEAAA